MKYNKKIVTAEFISRPNRFNAVVKLNREEITVHVPNTGRCRELLIPGCTVFLREELNPTRKTPYDLMAVYKYLTIEWAEYMKYLSKNYPSLYCKALINNPFDTRDKKEKDKCFLENIK